MEPDPIYPVTGAQEIYREPDSEPEPRAADPRPADPRPADPRLAGLRYDELRYDDSESSGDPRYGERRYDEPLDDEAWYAELRRSGPAYPQRPSGPQGPGEPVGQPGPGRLAGAVGGPPQAAGYDRSPGYPLGNGPGPGPRLSAAPGTAPVLTRPVGLAQPGVSTQPGFGTRPVPMAPQGSGYQATPTFSPPAPVGVLTPPVGSRFEARADTPQARPSAVITGPDTTAWDAAPDAELGSLEEYWQEEGSYSALLEEFDDEAEAPSNTGTAAMESARRAIGRRRGRNSDHRLWLGLGGVVVVAAAAIFGIIKFEFPSNNGPAHEFVMPAKIAGYERASSLEKNSDLPALVRKFSKMLGVPASSVVSREYESNAASTVTVGTQTQIVMFIGAHLPNQSPANSLHAFIQQDKGAQVVNAGLMGGEAACVETPQPAALCAWFDNDSVGVVLSPTMSTGQLPGVMLTFRPQVEQVKK